MATSEERLVAGRNWGELTVDLIVIAFGAAVLWQAAQIRVTPAYSAVGPRTVPFLVGGGLLVIGCWLAFLSFTGRGAVASADSEDADPSLPTDWRALGMVALGLLLYLVLMVPAGFILASTILFAVATYAMGNQQVVQIGRNIVLGLAMSLLLYVAFTAGLGLRLPAGPFASWF